MITPLSPPTYSSTTADLVWVISVMISQAMLAAAWAIATAQTLPVHSLRKPKNTPARVSVTRNSGTTSSGFPLL